VEDVEILAHITTIFLLFEQFLSVFWTFVWICIFHTNPRIIPNYAN